MKTRAISIALISSLMTTGAFAKSFEESLETLLKTQIGMPAKVVKSYDLEGFSGVKFVSVESATSAQRFPLFASKDGNSIIGFSNLFFTQSAKDNETIQQAIKEIQKFNESAKDRKLTEIFKSIPDERVVNLKSTNKNATKTYIIVSDPECPHCRSELKKIEEKLESGHVKYILAPVGARTAFVKAQIAMDEIKNAKSDNEKISSLRKVYAENYKVSDLNRATKEIDEVAEKIYSSGLIRGVPFVFEMH
ncbi:MAG: thioredoxin domain-containing protein [Wolinella sp.]